MLLTDIVASSTQCEGNARLVQTLATTRSGGRGKAEPQLQEERVYWGFSYTYNECFETKCDQKDYQPKKHGRLIDRERIALVGW
jgi:hypothetical protein